MKFAEDTSRFRDRRIAEEIAGLLPADAFVLCFGDSECEVTRQLQELRADIKVTCHAGEPMKAAAGEDLAIERVAIPFADDSFDTIVLVDKLGKMPNAVDLLFEAKRLVRNNVVIKDRVMRGAFAGPILRLMDQVDPEPRGPTVRDEYPTSDDWSGLFDRVGLYAVHYEASPHLYPPRLSWIFDRSLHFVTSLRSH